MDDVMQPNVSDGAVEFDPYSATFFNDPFDTYRRLRDQAPVYHNEHYGFWGAVALCLNRRPKSGEGEKGYVGWICEALVFV